MMFDLNKNLNLSAKGVWFPKIFGIIIVMSFIFMPKRLTKREIYITFGRYCLLFIILSCHFW